MQFTTRSNRERFINYIRAQLQHKLAHPTYLPKITKPYRFWEGWYVSLYIIIRFLHLCIKHTILSREIMIKVQISVESMQEEQ